MLSVWEQVNNSVHTVVIFIYSPLSPLYALSIEAES
jgi:hypothetical protein